MGKIDDCVRWFFMGENSSSLGARKKNETQEVEVVAPQLGEETSAALIDSVFDSIVRNDHILLIGPRGSGKSYAARAGIAKAEQCDANGDLARYDNSVLVPGAQVIAQGNKELPRDYFFEPEFEFSQQTSQETFGRKTETVVKLRQPPLFLYAVEKDGGIHLPEAMAEPGKIAVRSASFEKDGRSISKFVLFLDEINRFNDGVLDSLLLLLEEGWVIYQGQTVKVPVTVVATMNPPGYDVSARSLSPPLLSRFSTVKTLYTAGLDTLVNVILPDDLKVEPVVFDKLRVHLFVAATLASWGMVDESRPSGVYLSPETKVFLNELFEAGNEKFRENLKFIAKKSDYGPDARATRDWILSSMRLLPDKPLYSHEELSVAAIKAFPYSVSNKLVLNFSPEAKPDEFRLLINALAEVASSIFNSEPLREVISKHLSPTTTE